MEKKGQGFSFCADKKAAYKRLPLVERTKSSFIPGSTRFGSRAGIGLYFWLLAANFQLFSRTLARAILRSSSSAAAG